MELNKYFLCIMALTITIFSCNKDDDNIDSTISGCTDESALNFNPEANENDGSCEYAILGCTNPEAINYDLNAIEDDGSCIILGCIDEAATNFNPEATNDDNSCEYSTSSLLNGSWIIVALEYSTEIDLSDVPTVGPLLGVQQIDGEATDAGVWTFQHPEYIYNNNLNFDTEAIEILGQSLPSVPVDVSSNGTWELVNNDTYLLTTDDVTSVESTYNILSIQNDMLFMNGTIPFSQEIMGLNLDLQIEVEMQLQKQ